MLTPTTRSVALHGRLDRHVRHSVVRAGGSASGRRIAYAMENSLRLIELPGESEGRLYCFRRVTLSGPPPQAGQKAWVDTVQEQLGELAAQAVLATTPAARLAGAVYFHNAQQAVEWLLTRVLHSSEPPPWFAWSLLGLARDADRDAEIRASVEWLYQMSVSTGAAAQILLAALGELDPVPLLAALSSSALGAWMNGWEQTNPGSHSAVAIYLDVRAKAAVSRAAEHFGWTDVHTLWLCAQFVAARAPGHPSASALRATLRKLEKDEALRRISLLASKPDERPQKEPGTFRQRAHFSHQEFETLPDSLAPLQKTGLAPEIDSPFSIADEAAQVVDPSSPASLRSAQISVGPEQSSDRLDREALDQRAEIGRAPSGDRRHENLIPPDRAGIESAESSAAAPGQSAASPGMSPDEHISRLPGAEPPNQEPDLRPVPLLDEPTLAGGLYFLLAVLRHLGVPRLIEKYPALQDGAFAEHLICSLAKYCGVDPADSALAYLRPTTAGLNALSIALASIEDPSALWPANFRRIPGIALDSAMLLRVWVLAVRRWCWRMGRLTLPAIVLRPGRVWIVRAELDIALPLEVADVRIRRIGLDIDPLWLPWFGPLGTVVRFHYREARADTAP